MMIMNKHIKVQNCALDKNLAGILFLGGFSSTQSAEFWSAADPEQGSCVLNNYARQMDTPTVNLISGRLVACYGVHSRSTCEIYQEGSWQHLQNTTAARTYHSSVATEDAVLLIGGDYSGGTTEWIPLNGSAAQPGPFTHRHGDRHCTIKISADIIVVTGGWGSNDYVTEYQLADGTETNLTALRQPRFGHACGVYQDIHDQQVRERFFPP